MSFIDELKKTCENMSQAKVAKAIGYSAATVNLVLKGNYKGDLNAVEKAFKGVFSVETVSCPILGDIPESKCISIQRQPFAATNHQRVLLFKSCKTCMNKKGD
jgi:transcriptional regulator with XRE-family HTH domain|nr:MAG TPA: DNA-binding protein [Caudoviricetes sp.]